MEQKINVDVRSEYLKSVAELLDDCLVRIHPDEFSRETITKTNERFYRLGGSIHRICSTSDDLRRLAEELVESQEKQPGGGQETKDEEKP